MCVCHCILAEVAQRISRMDNGGGNLNYWNIQRIQSKAHKKRFFEFRKEIEERVGMAFDKLCPVAHDAAIKVFSDLISC